MLYPFVRSQCVAAARGRALLAVPLHPNGLILDQPSGVPECTLDLVEDVRGLRTVGQFSEQSLRILQQRHDVLGRRSGVGFGTVDGGLRQRTGRRGGAHGPHTVLGQSCAHGLAGQHEIDTEVRLMERPGQFPVGAERSLQQHRDSLKPSEVANSCLLVHVDSPSRGTDIPRLSIRWQATNRRWCALGAQVVHGDEEGVPELRVPDREDDAAGVVRGATVSAVGGLDFRGDDRSPA